jgi:hypothetical protein
LLTTLLDMPPGERVKLAEIKRMAENDADYQNLTKDQEQQSKNELIKFRELKRSGARPSTCSAAQDICFTSERISTEVHNMFIC